MFGSLPNKGITEKSSSLKGAAACLKKEKCGAQPHSITSTQVAARPRVTFKALVKVIFIPCREEYKAVHLLEQMWYFGDDFELFKREAIAELRVVMARSGLSVKEASAEVRQCSAFARATGHNYDYSTDLTQSHPISFPLFPSFIPSFMGVPREKREKALV